MAGAKKYIVHANGKGVDDGAHGHHDYDDVSLYPADLPRADAQGLRKALHDDRIARLEAGAQAQLGSPEH